MRAIAAILIVSLIATTLGWMGSAEEPISYDLNLSDASFVPTTFLMAGAPVELGAQGWFSVRGGRGRFEMDWTTASGASIHISERALLFGGDPTVDEVVAMAGTRERWRKETAKGGKERALRATIGRIIVSIEGDLSYEDLFRIAQTLRPGYGQLL
jgi:hypothetical protein